MARTKGLEGAGNTWRLLVRLIKHIWDTGEIPPQMLFTVIMLIPKGNSGDFSELVVWKVVIKDHWRTPDPCTTRCTESGQDIAAAPE